MKVEEGESSRGFDRESSCEEHVKSESVRRVKSESVRREREHDRDRFPRPDDHDVADLKKKGRCRDPGDHDKSEGQPQVFGIYEATVHSHKHNALLVDFEQCRGLVHVSQVSSNEVWKIEDSNEIKENKLRQYWPKETMVWIKVISKEDGRTVGCSMKYVDQQNGKDLDVGNVKVGEDLHRRLRIESQKKGYPKYDVLCKRCQEHGHLEGECYLFGPDTEQKPVSALTEKMETVEIIGGGQGTKERHRSECKDKHRSERKDKHRSERKDKHRSERKDKHRSERKDKHRKRHGDEETQRDGWESDEEDYKERKKHRSS